MPALLLRRSQGPAVGRPDQTHFLPVLLGLLMLPAQGIGQTKAEHLTLLLSLEQPTIVAPFPGRVVLHLHNSGKEALWLYRRARKQAGEGASLEVHLTPMRTGSSEEISTPAEGWVLESAGLPRPRLVKVGPGEDYTEKTTLELVPALTGVAGESKPVWGRYQLGVTYRSQYSNGETLGRILGVALWQGEVESNAIEIGLEPPTGQGSISGKVASSHGQSVGRALVSLSDGEERLLDQVATDVDGRFSFTRLSFGSYWITVRKAAAVAETVVFRHLSLTATEPMSSVEWVLLLREEYEAKDLLRKPVLFRVTDRAGRPLDKARLEIVWSSGTVLDTKR